MAKNNEPQTLPEYIKWLKRAESKPHLYENDEYIRIKKELYQAKKLKQILQQEEKSYMGFGYQRKPMPAVEIVDTAEEEVVESVDVEVVEDTHEV